MKYLFVLLVFTTSIACCAQARRSNPKDTLYFELDKNYMVNGDNYRHLKGRAFKRYMAKRADSTGTGGYIYYLVDTILPLATTPTTKSLKNYIENDTFYYEGKYNKIIDQFFLRKKFLERFKIVFVNGDTLVIPRHIQYNSYYPIGRGSDLKDPRLKDTLLFKYYDEALTTSLYEPWKHYYSDPTDEGAFFFEELSMDHRRYRNLKVLDFYMLLGTIRSRYPSTRIDGFELSNYLKNYIIYLLKDEEYIPVKSSYEIE